MPNSGLHSETQVLLRSFSSLSRLLLVSISLSWVIFKCHFPEEEDNRRLFFVYPSHSRPFSVVSIIYNGHYIVAKGYIYPQGQ